MEESVKILKIPATRYTVGIGYVILPSEVNREEYVINCFRTETVTILTEQNEFLIDVKVDKWNIQLLEFPQKVKELGSAVCYINLEVQNEPIIIAVLSKLDESNELGENEFRLLKATKNGTVSISGRGDEGNLFINVDSKLEKGGKVFLNVTNDDKKAELNIHVKGKIDILSEGEIKLRATELLKLIVSDAGVDDKEAIIQYEKGVGFSYIDEFENTIIITEDKTSIFNKAGNKFLELNKDGISLGSEGKSKEAAALADTLAKLLKDILEGLIQAKTATAIGSQPLLNVATFIQLKKEVDKIKSKVVNLD